MTRPFQRCMVHALQARLYVLPYTYMYAYLYSCAYTCLHACLDGCLYPPSIPGPLHMLLQDHPHRFPIPGARCASRCSHTCTSTQNSSTNFGPLHVEFAGCLVHRIQTGWSTLEPSQLSVIGSECCSFYQFSLSCVHVCP